MTNKNYLNEEIIRYLIKEMGINTLKSEDNNIKIYTNLSGLLRDNKSGNPISRNDENKIRSWHYLSDRNSSIYVIFYYVYSARKNNGEVVYFHFSTCITANIISIRGVVEENKQEISISQNYNFRWEELEEVIYTERIEVQDQHNIEKDPTFWLTEETNGYVFYKYDNTYVNVPANYFATYEEASFFLNAIINPIFLEEIKESENLSKKISTYEENKEFQKILDILEDFWKKKGLLGEVDYHAIKIRALIGLRKIEEALIEYERLQLYFQSVSVEEQQIILKSVLKARSDIYTAQEKYYLAAQDNQKIAELEKEIGEQDMVIKYKNLQRRNYQKFISQFRNIPLRDRNIITVIKTDKLFKSDHLTLLNIDNLPAIQFPVSDPKINHSYIVHPYRTDKYLPIESYDYELLNDRLNEFFYFLQCLGATSISYEIIEDESNESRSHQIQKNAQYNNSRQNNSQNNSNQHKGDANINYGFSGGEVRGNLYNQKDTNVYQENREFYKNERDNTVDSFLNNLFKMGKTLTFDPIKKPYVDYDNLVWFPHEETWKNIARQRLSGNMLSYNEVFSSSYNQRFKDSEIVSINEELDILFDFISSDRSYLDINAEMGIKGFGLGINYSQEKGATNISTNSFKQRINNSYKSEIKINRNKNCTVHIYVVFKPMNEFY